MQPEDPPLALNAWLRWDTVRRSVLTGTPLGDVVEVGCGQGGFGVRLARFARSYRAFEPDSGSFTVASDRFVSIPSATVANMTLPDAEAPSADLVCAFEVLEHIEDDAAALRNWYRWVRPGKRLLISVPAHQHRFGPWDAAVGHFRRYGRAELMGVLRNAGFEVERISAYGFPLGYGLEWARNRLAPPSREETYTDRTRKSGRLLQPKPWMARLTQAATWPFRVLQRPFAAGNLGTGWVAVARRPT